MLTLKEIFKRTTTRLVEAKKEQLDISIKNIDKYVGNNRNSDKKIEEILSTPVSVAHKTDGVKLTLIYVNNTGDYTKDWIVSYKGEVMYDGEHNFGDKEDIKKSSIANGQFSVVFDHLKTITTPSIGIPLNTELFVEFLMRKPTLSSNYTQSHGMVLIAHSPTTYTVKFGKLKSNPTTFNTDVDGLAKTLKLDVPQMLFKGTMDTSAHFSAGILHPELKTLFNSVNSTFVWGEDSKETLEKIKQLFLDVESKYGGLEEGVVLTFDNGLLLKIQQSYQTDKESREAIKMKYREDTEDAELDYWKNVRQVALDIINVVAPNGATEDNFQKVLKLGAEELKKHKLDFTHTKRTDIMVKDDIQGNIKFILRKNMIGNNGALLLGKFRVLSKMHYQIIKDGIQKFDTMTVCLVTSKDTKFSRDIRYKMLETAFGDKIEIVEHSTGNIFSIMNKSDNNINVVMAGSDRVESYKEMLSKNPDMSVYEISRVDEDISATKIISNIEDEFYFKQNVPTELHSMYEEIRDFYLENA